MDIVENMTVEAMQRAKASIDGEGVDSYSMDGFSVSFDKELKVAFTEDRQMQLDKFKVTAVG